MIKIKTKSGLSLRSFRSFRIQKKRKISKRDAKIQVKTHDEIYVGERGRKKAKKAKKVKVTKVPIVPVVPFRLPYLGRQQKTPNGRDVNTKRKI